MRHSTLRLREDFLEPQALNSTLFLPFLLSHLMISMGRKSLSMFRCGSCGSRAQRREGHEVCMGSVFESRIIASSSWAHLLAAIFCTSH